jgi:hypothetical protein
MKTLHKRCAGLDVHKAQAVACVRIITKRKVERETRRFPTTTKGLMDLAGWVENAGCTHVAMWRTIAPPPPQPRGGTTALAGERNCEPRKWSRSAGGLRRPPLTLCLHKKSSKNVSNHLAHFGPRDHSQIVRSHGGWRQSGGRCDRFAGVAPQTKAIRIQTALKRFNSFGTTPLRRGKQRDQRYVTDRGDSRCQRGHNNRTGHAGSDQGVLGACGVGEKAHSRLLMRAPCTL